MKNPSNDPIRDGRFRKLLDGVQESDPDACKAIVEEYGGHLLRAVRRHMNRDIRDRADSEDFAQSVWGAFFGHISVVQKFDEERQLVGFLSRIASNKVIDAGRRRRVRRERPVAEDGELNHVVTDRRRRVSQATPSEHAVANERWSLLNTDVGELARKVLQMLRDGLTHAEIAAATRVSERHIRRIVAKFPRE